MRLLFNILILGLVFGGAAHAAGPIETSPYAVQGVEIDETDTSAKAAKDKAIIAVQMKAYAALIEKLGGTIGEEEIAGLDPKRIMPLLKSLSIEQETISPGRYQGKFTVRFLPARIGSLLSSHGAKLPREQGPALLVIPVWTNENGQAVLWEDNVWRKAWLNLGASQAQIPLIIPLGDQDDIDALTPQDALDNNAVKLEVLRRRYDVKTLLLAFGEPSAGGGIHARMLGTSPLGKITIDKVYNADTNVPEDSAKLAAERFQQLVTEKFKSEQAKAVAAKAASAGPQSLAVSIPFSGPSEWNGLRSRILSTPGVVGVDVRSLDASGAAARLLYTGEVQDVANSLQASGLNLAQAGGGWTISRF